MPSRSKLAVAAIAAALAVPALAQSSSPPQVDCAAPRGIEQRRACEAARDGVVPLRRFALTTRGFYSIEQQRYARTALEAERARAPVANEADRSKDAALAQAK